MAFCSYCGAQLAVGARFCSSCGAAQETTAAAAVVTAPTARMTVPGVTTGVSSLRGNSVMLVSLGSCSISAGADLLEDVCGYSASDALLIVSSAPITVARELTIEQASVLAQTMAEYGMDVTIFDETGYRTVNPVYTSVFDSNGSFLAAAASVLGLIGASNRLTRAMIRRHDYPYHYTGNRPPVFAMPRGYRPPAPRRYSMRGPVPPPAPARMHHPEPARPPVHHQEPRPMGGPGRPAGPVGNHGAHGGPGGNRDAGKPMGRPGNGGPGNRGGHGGHGGPGGFGGPGPR